MENNPSTFGNKKSKLKGTFIKGRSVGPTTRPQENSLGIVKNPSAEKLMLCRTRLGIGNFSFRERLRMLMGAPIVMSFALAINKKQQKIKNISFDYEVGLKKGPALTDDNIPEFGDVQKRNSE